MNLSPSNRLTPWVGRLIIANAVVLLLLLTVFTSPSLQAALQFAPGEALHRPWTFITYMFVHAGLLHLLTNMLVLFVFGPPVEHRLGGRAFILYYLYCGIGAAVLSLLLSGIMSSAATPVVGASGAVLGVAVAFALLWPDAELLVFPLPMPVKARTFILVLVGLDIVLSQLTPRDGVAHLAHIGGAGFGYLFFRLQAFSRRSPRQPPRAVERVVMVQSGAAEPERRTPPVPLRPRRRAEADPVAAEVDRVLDKISEQGINSLTPAERRFLDEVARKKKQEHGEDGEDGEDGKGGRSTLSVLSVFSVLSVLSCFFPSPFVLSAVLINLLPDFLAVLGAGDREAAYRQYREAHRPILDAYWRNYVLDPDSPHAGEIVTAALRADRSDLLGLADAVNLVQLAEEAIGRAEELLQVDRPTDTYLMVGLGGANAGELVVGGRGVAFICLEHFTGRVNPETYGMGLPSDLIPLWIGHELAHTVRYTSPTSGSDMRRLVADAGGYYDYWSTGSRVTLRELLVNEGLAVHAAQAVAPGFDSADYFGYPRRQYHRLREMEAFLRRVVEPDLEQSGLGLRLRYLSGGMSPSARLVGGRVLPERSGYYLGYRMTEALVAERGLAEALRAPASEFQSAEDIARGIQTA